MLFEANCIAMFADAYLAMTPLAGDERSLDISGHAQQTQLNYTSSDAYSTTNLWVMRCEIFCLSQVGFYITMTILVVMMSNMVCDTIISCEIYIYFFFGMFLSLLSHSCLAKYSLFSGYSCY